MTDLQISNMPMFGKTRLRINSVEVCPAQNESYHNDLSNKRGPHGLAKIYLGTWAPMGPIPSHLSALGKANGNYCSVWISQHNPMLFLRFAPIAPESGVLWKMCNILVGGEH